MLGRGVRALAYSSESSEGLKNVTDQYAKNVAGMWDQFTLGERLAVVATALGGPVVDASSPIFHRIQVKDWAAYVKFEDVSGGLESHPVVMNISREYLPSDAPLTVRTDGLEGF